VLPDDPRSHLKFLGSLFDGQDTRHSHHPSTIIYHL
jgi:hypothetical protein